MGLNLTQNITRREVQEFQARVRQTPVEFSEEILGYSLWDKEKEILISVRDNRETAVRSANTTGKTFTAARVVHWWLIGNEDAIVITTAPTGKQVKEVLWREIKKAVAGKKFYPQDAILETKINIDDKWFALGLSTDQPDNFQGFHSPHLLVVIDEASGVQDEIFEAIDGLKPERILYLGNPLRNTGRFAKVFSEEGVSKIVISAFDTPNIKASKVVIPGLVEQQDIDKFERRYGIDSDVYRIRVLGEFPKAEADTLISVDEVYQAMQREVSVDINWEKRLGVDPARFGDDRTAFVVRQREKVLRAETISQQDTMEITGRVMQIARQEGIRHDNIFVDAIGIGAGIVDRLREQGWGTQAVNVGVPAGDDTKDEQYLNLRAKLAVEGKEWLKTGQLTKDDDWYQLANIKYRFHSTNGKMQLESKEDIKKRGLPSPDLSDAFLLTLCPKVLVERPRMRITKQIGGNIKPLYPEMGNF